MMPEDLIYQSYCRTLHDLRIGLAQVETAIKAMEALRDLRERIER